MEKFQADSNNDIVKEPYKGSGPGVAIAGYAYLSHLGSMIAGLITIGTLAYFFHDKVNSVVGTLRSKATSGAANKGKTFLNWLIGAEPGSHNLYKEIEKLGKLGDEVAELKPQLDKLKPQLEKLIKEEEKGAIQKMASGLLNVSIFGWKPFSTLLNRQGEEQVSAIVMGSGVGAGLGYIASSIWAFSKGGHEGSAGKKQFKRAQAEIASLRETNDNLEEIDNNLRAEYVKELSKLKEAAATPTDEKLRVSPDDVPATRSEGTAVDAAKPATTTSLKDASLQGTLAAAPELAATPA